MCNLYTLRPWEVRHLQRKDIVNVRYASENIVNHDDTTEQSYSHSIVRSKGNVLISEANVFFAPLCTVVPAENYIRQY